MRFKLLAFWRASYSWGALGPLLAALFPPLRLDQPATSPSLLYKNNQHIIMMHLLHVAHLFSKVAVVSKRDGHRLGRPRSFVFELFVRVVAHNLKFNQLKCISETYMNLE